jgi:hypothetical protein
VDLFFGAVIVETSLLWPGRKYANVAHKEVYRDTVSVFVHVYYSKHVGIGVLNHAD